jgi:predicted SAM-dependent methyltransferase
MGIKDFSLTRPLTSYTKVQSVVSVFRRNQRWQMASPSVNKKHYINVGCGPNTHTEFINLEYNWQPGIDLCWDLTKGLPFQDRSMSGIFSEHCLEHFSLPTARLVVDDLFRILSPGGTIRIVVPDAGMYLDTYQRQSRGDGRVAFPFQKELYAKTKLESPMVSVNEIFYTDRDSPAGHQCMFDYSLLSEILHLAGFSDVKRCCFGEGRDPMLLIDTPSRRIESIYVEAARPT